MRDVPGIKFFKRDGRKHVAEWLGFMLANSELLALVPVFQDGLSLEQNVSNLRIAGRVDQELLPKHLRFKWHQGDFLYAGDVGLLVLVARAKDRRGFVAYLDQTRARYNQTAYILHDSTEARTLLVTAEGQIELPPFASSLDSLDELARTLIPAWTATQGNFDRSISYVQMRDHQTRPRPSQEEPPPGTEDT